MNVETVDFVEACRLLAPEMLGVLRRIALNKKTTPAMRIRAISVILDRAYGRSAQSLHLVVDDTASPGLLDSLGTVEKQQLLLTMQRTIEASAPSTSPSKGRPRTKDVTPGTNGEAEASRPLTDLTTPVASTLEAKARPIPPEREIQGPPEPRINARETNRDRQERRNSQRLAGPGRRSVPR